MSVDSTGFREVMGRFATGVTVVTIPGPERPHGITVNAFASVSLSPPLVLVCLDHDTTAHELIDGGVDTFAISILAGDQRHLGEHFADIDPLDRDPFETEATRTEHTGAPIFTEGLAYLDCTVRTAHPEGDHTIYVGAVEAAGILREDAEALTYFDGAWGTLGPDS